MVVVYPLISMSSDGPTPDALSQQILSVAPILRGQSSQSHASSTPSQSHQPHAQPPAASGDLIDFGQSHDPIPNSTSTKSHQAPPSQAALLDLQDALELGQPVKRVDTFTSDMDEFVDAKS